MLGALDAPSIEEFAQDGGRQAVREAEADGADEEATGDFIFDEVGASVGAGHAAAEATDGEQEEEATMAIEDNTNEPPATQKEAPRCSEASHPNAGARHGGECRWRGAH